MSLNALVNHHLDRGRRPVASRAAAAMARPLAEVDAGPAAPKPPDRNDAFDKLVKYIPTESITLYVAAMAAAQTLNQEWHITPKHLYWFFCFLTPVILLLIFWGKRKSEGKRMWAPRNEYPYWELAAALVAFMVWALAVPGGPYLQGGSKGVIAGFLAVLISAFLGLLEVLFKKPAKP